MNLWLVHDKFLKIMVRSCVIYSRPNIVGAGPDQKEVALRGKTSQGLKLLMSWMAKEGLLEMDKVGDDKKYGLATEEIAETVSFLQGVSQGRRRNWVQNYNSERAAAFEILDHMFVRT